MDALPGLRFKISRARKYPSFSNDKNNYISYHFRLHPDQYFSPAGFFLLPAPHREAQNILKRSRLCGKGPLQGHSILGKLYRVVSSSFFTGFY